MHIQKQEYRTRQETIGQKLTRLKTTIREILHDVVLQGRVIPRVGDSSSGGHRSGGGGAPHSSGSSAQRLAHEVEEAPALKSDTDERDERQKILERQPILQEGGHGSREGLP